MWRGYMRTKQYQNAITFCQTKTLWTIAQPQKMIPTPINTLVTMAGVEWNWMKVYKMMPANKKQIPSVNKDVKKQLSQNFSKWRIHSNTTGLNMCRLFRTFIHNSCNDAAIFSGLLIVFQRERVNEAASAKVKNAWNYNSTLPYAFMMFTGTNVLSH